MNEKVYDKNIENTIEHKDPKIYKDKLFPKMSGVNVNNLKIDYECVSFVTIPSESKKIVEITKKHILKYKKSTKDVTVVDATACVGCDTITLCNTFGKVIAIELDTHRFNDLNHNLQQYKFTNVETLNGDSTTIIPKLPYIDVIEVDCPWGGKDYKTKTYLRLQFGDNSLEQFILNCFNNDITPGKPKVLISKMPTNYDLEYLYSQLSPTLDIILYKLKKMNILAIERKQSNIIQPIKESQSQSQPQIAKESDSEPIGELITEDIIDKLNKKIDLHQTHNTCQIVDFIIDPVVDLVIDPVIDPVIDSVMSSAMSHITESIFDPWNTDEDFTLEQCIKTNIQDPK